MPLSVPLTPPYPLPELLTGIALFQFAQPAVPRNRLGIDPLPKFCWPFAGELALQPVAQPYGYGNALDSRTAAALWFGWE